MAKEWFCTICHRSGEFGSTVADARILHNQQQARDQQNNEWMERQYPGFTGPRTNCPGKFTLRDRSIPKSSIVKKSGILGGDDPWI